MIVPDAPKVEVVPFYSWDNGNTVLARVYCTITKTVSAVLVNCKYNQCIVDPIQNHFNICNEIDDTNNIYNITYFDSDCCRVCYTDMIIQASSFERDVISHVFEVTSSSCTDLTDITVTVFVTNACGDGPNTTTLPNVIGLHTTLYVLYKQ